jgi:DNA-binding beta-propeller fold protein YncE
MRGSRPIGGAAFTGNRLGPVLALIGALLVFAAATSVASAASFVKSWAAPAPEGIAVGGGHVYVANRDHHLDDHVQAFTTSGDLQWKQDLPYACSVAFRHSDGHVFVGTCGVASGRIHHDGIYEYDARGRSAWSLVGFADYHWWRNIQAVAVHGERVYFSEHSRDSVMETGWPNGPWGTFGFDQAPGLALTANRVYAIKADRVRVTQGNRVEICFHGCGYAGFGFGSGPGSANGQFKAPQGIAVGGPHGNVYVADTGNNRIQEFTHNGAFLTAWTGPGPGGGNFKAPMDVGVDASGHVYVADSGNGRIVKFTP